MKTLALMTLLCLTSCSAQVHDIGVVTEELQACYAAKSKVKARQGCWGYWTENSQGDMFNESGLCPESNHFFIYAPDNQPDDGSGDALFEVDYKVCQSGACGWRLKEYVRCSCDNTPCRTSDSEGN